MNDLADFPTIQAEPMPVATQPAAPEPGTLKATALASFVAIRSHAAKLAEKYRAVAYDVTTPKGMAAAAEPLPAPVARAMAAVFDACVPMPAPTLTLGKINEWLAPLKIDAAGLELLGFPAVKVHNAKLYQETDRPAIIAKLVNHLLGL